MEWTHPPLLCGYISPASLGGGETLTAALTLDWAELLPAICVRDMPAKRTERHRSY